MVELVEKELEANSSVCPSAGAAATKPAPMDPAAPGRFSTTTGRPSAACSASATGRAKLSLLPPGVKGTTRRMFWFGQPGVVARAGVARARPAAAPNRPRRVGNEVTAFPPAARLDKDAGKRR